MTTDASLSDLTTPGKHPDNNFTSGSRIIMDAAKTLIWQSRLDLGVEAVNALSKLLSEDEQYRASRFYREADRRRYVVARGQLRRLLSSQLHVQPASIRFSYSKLGKPLLGAPDCPLNFNVSHSGDLALFAFSENCHPGIDIELLQRQVEYDNLARRFFSPNEYALLMNIPVESRKRAFLAVWTRKEAVIKALGEGLALSLKTFEVTADPDSAPSILAADDQRIFRCHLHTVPVGCDAYASLAEFSE